MIFKQPAASSPELSNLVKQLLSIERIGEGSRARYFHADTRQIRRPCTMIFDEYIKN